MKKSILSVLLFLVLTSTQLFAHHPAADIVDEDVYEMIDSMVADTPHADMVFDDMGNTTSTEINTLTVTELDNLVDDGLMDYAAMLDGDVEVSITFPESGGASLVITQKR